MKPNEHIAPFLAQPVNLNVGLNHLGYRNAAEVLFTTLLPGFNNVTSRIRYYSFYCWLLDTFFTNYKEPTIADYQRFIRYSEYLVAILNAGLSDPGGIPGIDYAAKVVEGEPQNVDLQAGTYNKDNSTRGTYWANKGGILVQYYGNSLQDIGITVPNQKVLGLSDISKSGPNITGKELANAFQDSIGSEASQVFLGCIKTGVASQKQMEILRVPFTMKGRLENQQERELLIKLLLQEDYPGRGYHSFRRETIKLYLEFIDSKSNDSDDDLAFPKHLYECYTRGINLSDCVTGWYCYYLNDLWQYNTSAILERILDILQKEKNSGWVKLDDLSSEIADQVSLRFGAHNKLLSEVLQSTLIQEEKDNIGRISTAIHDILQYHRVNDTLWPKQEVMIKALGYNNEEYDFRSASKFISTWYDNPFRDFVKSFIETKIIYRHYNVSLRKYYQTGLASHKFMMEDGYIRYLKGTFTTVTHTSPRIISLKGFLYDLGLINGNALTMDGKLVLDGLQ